MLANSQLLEPSPPSRARKRKKKRLGPKNLFSLGILGQETGRVFDFVETAPAARLAPGGGGRVGLKTAGTNGERQFPARLEKKTCFTQSFALIIRSRSYFHPKLEMSGQALEQGQRAKAKVGPKNLFSQGILGGKPIEFAILARHPGPKPKHQSKGQRQKRGAGGAKMMGTNGRS